MEKGKTKISRVRVLQKDGKDKDGNVLATFPKNRGSGIIIEGDCIVEVEIDGKWQKIWELKISSRYQRCDVKCDL